MLRRYAHFVMKLKWVIIALWVVAVAAVMLFLPNLQTVVSHQSTTYLPNTAPSQVAAQLANQVDVKHQAKSTVIVAIQDPRGLTATEKQYLTNKLQTLENNKTRYNVTYTEDVNNTSSSDTASSSSSSGGINSVGGSSSGSSKFISKDGTTEIAVVGLSTNITDPSMKATLNTLYNVFSSVPSGAHVYFTGDVPIQEDAITVTQHAADKTALVTVVLVLAILLIVFRSILAPILTLLAIGLSYLVSSGVVAWAAERGLPVSTFTQTFLIAILFGAGTDYSLILLNRFREELTKSHDREEALAKALQGVSKTVLFSGLTVLVSFAVLYFAKFGLYRSAVGVAIGIFITLVTCLTLLPALMSVLGRALYWPRHPKPGADHRPSRIWGATSVLSTKRPWWVLLCLAIVLTPIGLLFSSERTFDPMIDIRDSNSALGFTAVSNAFGQGETMPTTVVLKTDANLRTPAGLATINNLSKSMQSQSGVDEVDSATQPLGTVITGFQLANQNQQAATGLKKVQTGLSQLSSQLGGATGSSGGGLSQLQNGSQGVTNGTLQTAEGATKLASGSSAVGKGADSVSSGLSQVSQSAKQLASGSSQLATSEGQLSGAASSLADAIAAWAKQHPADATSPQWQQIQALATQLSQGTAGASKAATQLAQGTNGLAGALPGLQNGAAQVAGGVKGLTQGANQLASGATQLAAGSQQVTNGVATLNAAIGKESKGLGQAAFGASQLASGVGSAVNFLQQSGNASDPGFNVPADTIQNNKDLQQAMDAYISPDGHIAKFSVVLKSNPYSAAAIALTNPLKQNAQTALESSPIHTGTLYIGGTTGVQANMNQLSNQDFVRTMFYVLVAIFLLLVLMLRSILTPLFILVSLVVTYWAAMGIVQMVAIHGLHDAGVAWSVPFFAFLLLVALGVDYSIFLMSRFDEEYRAGFGPVAAMRRAMRMMGNVVFSAALIMAGTFGSMTITGMADLVEIGTAVIVGLFLYSFVLLAFFMPASIGIMGRAHGWPFVKSPEVDDDGPESGDRQTGDTNVREGDMSHDGENREGDTPRRRGRRLNPPTPTT